MKLPYMKFVDLKDGQLKKIKKAAKRVHDKLSKIRDNQTLIVERGDDHREWVDVTTGETFQSFLDRQSLVVRGRLTQSGTIFIDIEIEYEVMEDDKGHECSNGFDDGWNNFMQKMTNPDWQ